MKKLIVIAALGVGALAYFGRKKVNKISDTLSELKVSIIKASNVTIGFAGISLNLDLRIVNPTNTPINIDTIGSATLKRLIYKDAAGNFLAESYPNITQINIPAGQTTEVKGLPTTIMTNNLGSTINNLLDVFVNPEQLQVSAEIETPAGTYII